LGPKSGMDVIDSGLKPDRSDTWYTQHLSVLFISDIAAIHDASIGLLNPVAINRIVEKEREVRIQIQPVILAVRIGKELTARGRIVVIVQPSGAARCITSLGRIDAAESI